MPKKFKEIKPFPYGEVLLYQNEIFLLITDKVVPYVYDYYCISTYGRVWHRYLNKFIKPGINGAGYLFFMASTEFGPKPVQIHRAVMITFNCIENYNNLEVNHLDGNKLNPIITNLEWSTHAENVIHAYSNNLQKSGEDNCHSVITNNDAEYICKLLETNNYTNKEIANIIGGNCTESIVSSIKQKESWNNISRNFKFCQRAGKLFTEDMIRNICMYFENNNIGKLTVNEHCRNALRYYSYNDSDNYVDSARKIYNKKYYTNISYDYKF